jgi:butyryl-CoA dehydrogenase
MDFTLNENQQMIQDMVRKFAKEQIEPRAAESDKTGEFPKETIRQMAELGLMGMVVPEKYGGAGFDFVSLAIAIEEVSRACASTGVIAAVNNTLVAYPIYQFGNEEQRAKFLPGLSSGKTLGAFGLTEPNAGSDPAGLETTAKREGDYYILNGAKRFITNAGEAGVFIVFASTNRALGHKGITCFLVEKGAPGFSVGKHEDLMGMRATANTELIMEDCRVPAANAMGKEGDGFKIAMHILDCSRIDIGA